VELNTHIELFISYLRQVRNDIKRTVYPGDTSIITVYPKALVIFLISQQLAKKIMAYQGKIITNPKTGQQLKFIKTNKDTNGSMLEMESVFQPHSAEPAPHYHPKQQEVFTVTEGSLTVRINEVLKIFSAGDQLIISPNTIHSMWNHTSSKAVVNWKVYPALDTEYFFETAMGIANHQQTNELGMPGILQLSLMANKFSHVFRLAKPSFTVQQIIFTLLKPFAYLAGYQPQYKEYID